MKVAAAYAIADTLKEEELSTECVIPKAFDPRVGKNVAQAVRKAARDSGVARL
jgi:malate dehydrogenase (oxaloacetate-decarboxylating)